MSSTKMILQKTQRFIQQHQLLKKSDRVLVAYSGGPDSTCLLLLLQQLGYKVAAVYVNHHLRGQESEQEEQFVRDFCVAHNIPLFVERMQWKKKPSNMEEAARRKRYRYYAKVASENRFPKIALAHTENDAAETLLLRLIRGSGPLGLAALQPLRGIYVRPLLGSSRKEIVDFLNENKVRWFDDSSNANLQFQRNRVRHELLPYLEKNFNPNVVTAVARTHEWLQEEKQLHSELLKPFAKKIRVKDCQVSFPRKDYLQLSLPLRKAVLRIALQKSDASLKLNARLLTKMNDTIENGKEMELPGFLVLKSTADRIEFASKTERIGYAEVDVPHEGVFSYPAARAELKFSLRKNPHFKKNRSTAYLDAGKAAFPLHIRNWKKGDSFQPLGMKGHKKLSDFWIDRKVPRIHRKQIPLVFKEEDLVWVAGYEIDHKYRVSEDTKNVLCIELLRSDV